jgi:hypothetical protein
MQRRFSSIIMMAAAVAATSTSGTVHLIVTVNSQMRLPTILSHRQMPKPKLLLVEKLSGLSVNQLLLFAFPRIFWMQIMKNLTLTVMSMFCPQTNQQCLG